MLFVFMQRTATERESYSDRWIGDLNENKYNEPQHSSFTIILIMFLYNVRISL